MKTALDDHGSRDAGQQGWIRRWRRCGTATDEMWYDGDDEMGCKEGDRLGKYLQGTTANLSLYHHSWILGMAYNISGEDSVGRAWWIRCVTTGVYTAV